MHKRVCFLLLLASGIALACGGCGSGGSGAYGGGSSGSSSGAGSSSGGGSSSSGGSSGSVQAANYAPSGAKFNGPTSVTTDSQGNVWVANSDGSVSELPVGNYNAGARNFPAPSPGLNGQAGIVVDSSDNIWVTVPPSNTAAFNGVLELAAAQNYKEIEYPSSVSYQPSECLTLGGDGIAVDSKGNVWVAGTFAGTVTELVASNNYTANCYNDSGTYFNQPLSITVDQSNNVWIANQGSDSVSELPVSNYNSSQNYSQPYFSIGTGGEVNPGIAVDSAGNIWIANGDSSGNAYLIELVASNGYQVKTWGPSGGNYGCIYSLTVDGGDNVWASDYCSSIIYEFVAADGYAATAFSPSSAGFNGIGSIAVDSSGNVWVVNTSDNSVSELLGVAVPKKSP